MCNIQASSCVNESKSARDCIRRSFFFLSLSLYIHVCIAVPIESKSYMHYMYFAMFADGLSMLVI